MITFSKNCWRGQWNRDKFFFFSSFVVPQMNWYANIHINGSQSVHKKWKQWQLLMSSVYFRIFLFQQKYFLRLLLHCFIIFLKQGGGGTWPPSPSLWGILLVSSTVRIFFTFRIRLFYPKFFNNNNNTRIYILPFLWAQWHFTIIVILKI